MSSWLNDFVPQAVINTAIIVIVARATIEIEFFIGVWLLLLRFYWETCILSSFDCCDRIPTAEC